MAWTKITRAQYRRDGLRYASDVSDEEWLLIESLLPRARRLGRPRRTCLRSIVNALFYMASSGCAWRLLPKDFPPVSTVQRFFYAWRADLGSECLTAFRAGPAVRPTPAPAQGGRRRQHGLSLTLRLRSLRAPLGRVPFELFAQADDRPQDHDRGTPQFRGGGLRRQGPEGRRHDALVGSGGVVDDRGRKVGIRAVGEELPVSGSRLRSPM